METPPHTQSLTHSSWHVCVVVASRTIRLNTPLFWASLPASVELIGSQFFMSSVHLLVGRPFLLLPSSLASNMCLSRKSCLFRWPKYDSFRTLMHTHPKNKKKIKITTVSLSDGLCTTLSNVPK